MHTHHSAALTSYNALLINLYIFLPKTHHTCTLSLSNPPLGSEPVTTDAWEVLRHSTPYNYPLTSWYISTNHVICVCKCLYQTHLLAVSLSPQMPEGFCGTARLTTIHWHHDTFQQTMWYVSVNVSIKPTSWQWACHHRWMRGSVWTAACSRTGASCSLWPRGPAEPPVDGSAGRAPPTRAGSGSCTLEGAEG